ncbi:hypothetical protein NB689_001894 [Xanthomonas sacchari]|nr:hypothetical protein [Xanthomonas sacchari]
MRTGLHLAVESVGIAIAALRDGVSVDAAHLQRERLQRPLSRARVGTEEQREQAGLERRDALAGGGGALGEQHHVVIRAQLRRHGGGHRGRILAAPADEHGLRQRADVAHARPAFHIVLGDEARAQQAAQHHDVEVGDVVADEQRAARVARRAHHLDANAQRAPQAAEPQPWQHERATAAGEAHQQPLWRDQQHAGRDADGESDDGAHAANRGVCCVSGRSGRHRDRRWGHGRHARRRARGDGSRGVCT